MTTCTHWYTSNLPNNQTDLDKLVQWFHEHDPDWMADALWLRYLKIRREIYHPNNNNNNNNNNSDTVWAQREADFDQLPFINRQNELMAALPFAIKILPEISLHDEINRFSALPYDIRIEVLSHLRLPDVRMDRHGNGVAAGHPLCSLALASKGWRDQVEAFCGHSLLVWKHEAEARLESVDISNWVGWRTLATYTANARMEYAFRTRKYCGVCVQPARQIWMSRKWPGLPCCDVCEFGICQEYFG
ncbi:hypothetical protein Q7P35_002128 [Cladosporium inversicolor]